VLSDELHDLRGRRDGAAPAPASAAGNPEVKIGRRLRGITRKAEAIAASADALPLSPTVDSAPDPAPAPVTEPEQPRSGAEQVAAPPEHP
jgi:hypothetical protein